MLGHLIRKEILDHVLGLRFLILSVLGALVIWLSVYNGYSHYRMLLHDYRLAEMVTEERIADLRANGSWEEFFREGHLIHKPPTALSIFVQGLEPTLGRSIPLRSGVRDLQWSPAGVDPMLDVFPRLGLGVVVQIVISLFVLLFTYDAISGEKEGGTLRIVASYPVPRYLLLLAKVFGALIPILAAFGLPTLLGIAVLLLMPDVDLDSTDLGRLAMILTAFLLYLVSFTCAGLFASALTHRAATAFVLSLALWLSVVVVLPRLSLVVASGVRPAPSPHLLAAELSEVGNRYLQKWYDLIEKWGEEHPRWRETAEGREAHEKYRADLRETVGIESEPEKTRLKEAFENRYQSWLDLTVTLARLSPTFALNNATIRLAGTGLDRHERFSASRLAHRKIQARWVIEGKNRDTRRRANPQKYGEYEWDISDMPRFVYHDAPSSEEVQTAMVDVGLLAIWGLVLFLGACVAMLRYDLR